MQSLSAGLAAASAALLEGRGAALAARCWPAASEPRAGARGDRASGRRATAARGASRRRSCAGPPELDELRLWIEEYRVSLYAQELKTVGPGVGGAGWPSAPPTIEAWLAR